MNQPANPDLAWDLDQINNRERAERFIMQFETTLCVYSASVEQLYSSYHMYFPEEYDGKLIIIPDATAFHDTYNFIDSGAVTRTGLHIIPGELVDRQGLHLANIDANRSLGTKQIPFGAGMRAIASQRPEGDPFLPVLAKGDLREFQESWPVLHLHRLQLPKLTNISNLERVTVRQGIQEKLDALIYDQQQAKSA